MSAEPNVPQTDRISVFNRESTRDATHLNGTLGNIRISLAGICESVRLDVIPNLQRLPLFVPIASLVNIVLQLTVIQEACHLGYTPLKIGVS